jgi:hypothetical protein
LHVASHHSAVAVEMAATQLKYPIGVGVAVAAVVVTVTVGVAADPVQLQNSPGQNGGSWLQFELHQLAVTTEFTDEHVKSAVV